ncbi:uncharacterized protein N7459_004877 [Penicillium hispanicum]|uniref:uncharacterized protein n=1 Tax=Penicillium hispanicum TaxID=1080232 RepID=UPI002541E64E|nr:uncharacterized protein N7459_004877 [Penicillium hispanicum]KAJ5585077.1 hypothetical protein N7459_004877 [Penicillium hispanicum]
MPAPAPIKEAVVQVSPLLWRLGSKVECKKITEPEQSSLATWKDGDSWYMLQTASSEQPPSIPAPSSNDCRLIHEGGTLSAVWAIGNDAFCKVKKWDFETSSESDAIEFVRKHAPQVPVPEVIYTWMDKDQSFLVLKRVPGVTLRDAWQTLSANQQDSILNEVVHLCDILASVTSPLLQNVQGGSVLEPYLAHSGEQTLEPLTVSDCKKYFCRAELDTNPDIGEEFYLYHPDLGPGNIMILDQKISAIIDWESAGFYPRFWISTKPSVSPGHNFYPPVPGVEDHEWRRRLRGRLEEQGYPYFDEWYMKWMRIPRG